MFGVTDSITELTKLATQFLPAQVATALANGFNPTVYAAEALGLGLAGGNGTSNNFATNFGTTSVSAFAQSVASITGVNAGAIQGFAQSWINFYTSNPAATHGLSVTLASYGAAFGDAIGVALLNPPQTLGGGSSGNGVQIAVTNALFDNAQGMYQVGVPIQNLPTPQNFQGNMAGMSGALGTNAADMVAPTGLPHNHLSDFHLF
jgi:hypothetical protein